TVTLASTRSAVASVVHLRVMTSQRLAPCLRCSAIHSIVVFMVVVAFCAPIGFEVLSRFLWQGARRFNEGGLAASAHVIYHKTSPAGSAFSCLAKISPSTIIPPPPIS